MKNHQVKVEEDSEGNYFIPLSDEVLDFLNISDGDTVEWYDNGDGSFTLTTIINNN